MPETAILRLILGDQLDEKHLWFRKVDPAVTYVLMEMRQETDVVVHHIQKVAAFFAAMRAFAQRLRDRGHRVVYLALDDPRNRQTLAGNLTELLTDRKIGRFEYLLPDEYRLDLELQALAQRLPLPCQSADTQHFLTQRHELADFFGSQKRRLMASFYRWLRKRHDIMLEKGRPVGGKWSFDSQNRRAYDGRVPNPRPLLFKNDVSELVAAIRAQKVVTMGEIRPDSLSWPVTRSQSLELLKRFVKDGLPAFGTYQDAMTLSNWHLFHSRLSFALNTKLLHPMEVIQTALSAWENNPVEIGLQQIEGFVRQILGWREYMRGIYWEMMPGLAAMNFFDHRTDLPAFYWNGETRMTCLRAAVGQSLTHAYAHHIQRLMVTGNFALLAGVHPDAVDEWYLGIYIDALQWVELPNTRAMSQFADGGRVATKPYAASARYIHSMSDYCDTCTYRWNRRHGSDACPFNSLYWDFFQRQRPKLAKNPRVGMVYRTWDKMEKAEKEQILKQARLYRSRLEHL